MKCKKVADFYACSHLDKLSKYYYSYYFDTAADKLAYKKNPECIVALFTPFAAHRVLHVHAKAVRQR